MKIGIALRGLLISFVCGSITVSAIGVAQYGAALLFGSFTVAGFLLTAFGIFQR
jgi:hypothetical protein